MGNTNDIGNNHDSSPDLCSVSVPCSVCSGRNLGSCYCGPDWDSVDGDYYISASIALIHTCETEEENHVAHKTRAEQRQRPKQKREKFKSRKPKPYRRPQQEVEQYIEDLNEDWTGDIRH